MSENEVNRDRQPAAPDGAPSMVVTPSQRPSPVPYTASSPASSPAPNSTPSVSAPQTGGVNTLRAILLGRPSHTADDTRLTAIERRLDTLSLQVARAPIVSPAPAVTPPPVASPSPLQEARLAEIERRLDAQSARLDATGVATRGSDVTLGALTALQHQVETLRQDHAQMAEQTAARLREVDERCQMRQLRARTARRQELLRLRRRVYAPAETLSGSPRWTPSTPNERATRQSGGAINEARLASPAATAPVWPVSPEHRPPVVAVSAAPNALIARSEAQPARDMDTARNEHAEHATIRRELDMDGAWRVLGRSLTALFHALATVVLVVARLAGNDLRAAWRALVGLVRGRHEDDEDFDNPHHDYRN